MDKSFTHDPLPMYASAYCARSSYTRIVAEQMKNEDIRYVCTLQPLPTTYLNADTYS
jgi:hypothetical protein